jgi:hypothetical protein
MIAWKRGSERVIFRVDVDVQHPVVVMLVRLFQPIENEERSPFIVAMWQRRRADGPRP